jgi:hypothetical protein
MSGDVLGGRVAARVCEPALAETDEDPREAPGAGRVVVVAAPMSLTTTAAPRRASSMA